MLGNEIRLLHNSSKGSIRMIKQLGVLSAAFVAITVSSTAYADSIVEWDLTGAAGSQASNTAFSAASHVAGDNLVRGAGLTGSGAANSISASAWSGQATDYFGFGFTVAEGYQADLISLVIGTRSSATGPGTMGLFHSGDGFASALYTFNQAPGSNYVNSIVDLSALIGLTGKVEFRVAQIGTTSANGGTTGTAGTFRISEYYDGVSYTNLQLNGSVAAVPEPETYAMLLAGLGLLGFAARRRAK
jgi:hypothetical protein